MQTYQTHRRRAGRLCMPALLLGTPARAEQRTYGRRQTVVGYYAGWAAYQGYTPDQIPAEHLTQINYAFARIDPDTLTIALENPAHDKKNLAALRQLRQEHPHLKLLISVGGWSDSPYFSDAAATAARRERFAASCVDFVVEHGLDGVDLDWEYPVSGGAPGTIHRPADRQNFTKLLQELRTQLDRQGRRDGKDYSLTIAGAAGSWYLNQIEAVKVADIVDHIFLMGYDLHGPWDTYADFNAPLYTPSGASPQGRSSIADSVQAYLDKGIPAEKIVLGMPLYGYAYQGVSSQNNGLYSTYTSARSVSYKTLKKSYLSNAAYRQLRHRRPRCRISTATGPSSPTTTRHPLPPRPPWPGPGPGGHRVLGAVPGRRRRADGRRQQRLPQHLGNPFRDVAPGAWYEEAVRYVYEAGLMQGTSGTAFSPGRTPPGARSPPSSTGWRAAPGREGALHRCGGGQLLRRRRGLGGAKRHRPGLWGRHLPPGRPITRQQLAAILFRYMEHRGADTSGRADLTASPTAPLWRPTPGRPWPGRCPPG